MLTAVAVVRANMHSMLTVHVLAAKSMGRVLARTALQKLCCKVAGSITCGHMQSCHARVRLLSACLLRVRSDLLVI
jgi:hypothetical protein